MPTFLVPTRPSTCLAPNHNPPLKICTCLASVHPLTHIPALLVTALAYTYPPLAKSLQLRPAASPNPATHLTASPQPIPQHSDMPHANLPHYTLNLPHPNLPYDTPSCLVPTSNPHVCPSLFNLSFHMPACPFLTRTTTCLHLSP